MRAPEIQPATRDAVITLRGTPPPHSGHAVMAIDAGGNPVAAGGVYRIGHALVVWLRLSEQARAHPHWIGRHVEAVLELARGRGLPVLAEPDPGIPGSERLLRFAGFHPTAEGVWVLPGAENG